MDVSTPQSAVATIRIEDGVPWIGDRSFPWASGIDCNDHEEFHERRFRLERSFELSDELRAAGTQKWTSHYRWIGPFRFMAYKEVGPPPWRWPRIGIQPWRGKNHPCVRFIIGWRSTAYAFVVMWYGTGGSKSHD